MVFFFLLLIQSMRCTTILHSERGGKHKMKLFSVIAVGVLALCTPIVHAVDFADFKTCAQCIDAGFGWCPIQRYAFVVLGFILPRGSLFSSLFSLLSLFCFVLSLAPLVVASAKAPSSNPLSFSLCPIFDQILHRMCGGFANTNCGEGENYWRKDYVPGKGKGKKGKKGKKASDSKPVYLTGANMTKTLEESDRFWVVKFSNTDGNDEDLKTLAKTVRGIAKVAHVDFSDDASSGLKNTHASGVTCFIKGATHVHPSTSPSLANTLEWLYSLVSKTISERTQ